MKQWKGFQAPYLLAYEVILFDRPLTVTVAWWKVNRACNVQAFIFDVGQLYDALNLCTFPFLALVCPFDVSRLTICPFWCTTVTLAPRSLLISMGRTIRVRLTRSVSRPLHQ